MARIGLNLTMHIGMGIQVVALTMLTVPDAWLSVPYVMAAQALSGIAKDLNKMSAKASVKTLTGDGGESKLFKYVALLTGVLGWSHMQVGGSPARCFRISSIRPGGWKVVYGGPPASSWPPSLCR